jgi:hypothetical protein
MQDVSERILQWYSKCYCVGSATKMFINKGVQTSVFEHLDLSTEKAPHKNKTATFRRQSSDEKQYLVTSSKVGSKSRYTGWLIVSRTVAFIRAASV